jgi:hypothetical protein
MMRMRQNKRTEPTSWRCLYRPQPDTDVDISSVIDSRMRKNTQDQAEDSAPGMIGVLRIQALDPGPSIA